MIVDLSDTPGWWPFSACSVHKGKPDKARANRKLTTSSTAHGRLLGRVCRAGAWRHGRFCAPGGGGGLSGKASCTRRKVLQGKRAAQMSTIVPVLAILVCLGCFALRKAASDAGYRWRRKWRWKALNDSNAGSERQLMQASASQTMLAFGAVWRTSVLKGEACRSELEESLNLPGRLRPSVAGSQRNLSLGGHISAGAANSIASAVTCFKPGKLFVTALLLRCVG